ncbi:biotin--[acetyl-CoA-carboxylase] ligase [uncultured Acinetobacter sp.]|uniref:biotin--[acetyl-CoA-carboxylase] ligase n=1 Tax=uncultured Acinetobacter sp. TaxID=165433 RepID=UPI00261DCF3C|nr:biotin--[acetyl-CoA-carboxylase] ligase [uncultured Acinetobacter sp.]
MDLETRQLQQRLEQRQHLPEVLLVKPMTQSTNDDVREIAKTGVQHVLVCSHQQSAGRGQRQRAWVSPVGNIYLSALLNLNTVIDGRLSLEIALNILHIPSLKDLDLQIKWPNDLYSLQGKWGGILIEPISPTQVIVGVGINIESVSDQVQDQATTSLVDLGIKTLSRIDLIAEVYVAIQNAGQWFDHQSSNLAARFEQHAAFKNQQVAFEHIGGISTGRFLGIANDGAVIIDTELGSQAFYQGRLRLAEGAS